MVHVVYSTKIHHACLMENARNDTQETYLPRLSLAMTDIHSIVDDQFDNNVEVDNRWVVPYSPLLSKTYKAHINVEYCNSVKSTKYICQYVNKGSDMAVFGVGNATASINEIGQYQLGRYISSNEAVWRI